MADSITSSANLTIGIEFDDEGTTRTTSVTIPNYKANLTRQEIKDIFDNNQVLIYGYDENIPKYIVGDNVVTASTTNQTIKVIDIGVE